MHSRLAVATQIASTISSREFELSAATLAVFSVDVQQEQREGIAAVRTE